MIRLHLLGFTHDLKGLVFSGRRGGRTGTYWLPVDDTLLQALSQLEQAREEAAAQKKPRSRRRVEEPREEDEQTAEGEEAEAELLLEEADEGSLSDSDSLPAAAPEGPARAQSKLSPREIQQLLREGRSVKDVATQADVEPAWVERFIGPVLEERAGVVRMLQSSVQARPRLGPSGLPIGAAVLRNLRDRKATPQTLEEAEEGWDARRIRPRMWRVRLRYRHRGKRYLAEWELRRDTGQVTPRNKLAAELGWWPPPVPASGRSGERARSASATGAAKAGKAKGKAKTSKRTTKPAKKRGTNKATKPVTKRGTKKATKRAPKRSGKKAASQGRRVR